MFNEKIYNVKDYGGVGDGLTLNTKAIQAAIDACGDEGGTVYFPAGKYVTGTIFLKSNITIYLSKLATILGSRNIKEDYKGDYKGCVEAPSFDKCLIYAENEEKITFAGEGKIDGQGEGLYGDRPMMFRFIDCKNIRFKDIELRNSVSWCCHMISCDTVHIDSVYLYNCANRNNDGFDLDGCSNVFISNTKITSIDDSICLKSTTDIPCKNIVVNNCVISSQTATVKLGTSSKAGFKDISISNCVFYDCEMGTIKLIVVDGGILENVNISNIVMNNVGSPLFIRLGKRGLKFEEPAENDFVGKGKEVDTLPGEIKNIMISNIQAVVTVNEKSKTPMMITGLKDAKVKNITLSNFNVTYPGGGNDEDAARQIDEDEFRYPEQSFFGILPAYGLYLRHVEGIELDRIRFKLSSDDKRKALVCDNVKNINIYHSNIVEI